MRILVTSGDVLTVLPRLLDHLRRLGIAAQAITAEPMTSVIRIKLDRRMIDQTLADKLQTRFSQVAGVESVVVPEVARKVTVRRSNPIDDVIATEISR